jgi:hypothetical protein
VSNELTSIHKHLMRDGTRTLRIQKAYRVKGVKLDAGATWGAYVVTKGPGTLWTLVRLWVLWEYEGTSASRNGPRCKSKENQLR